MIGAPKTWAEIDRVPESLPDPLDEPAAAVLEPELLQAAAARLRMAMIAPATTASLRRPGPSLLLSDDAGLWDFFFDVIIVFPYLPAVPSRALTVPLRSSSA
jgi:hypothetical protein